MTESILRGVGAAPLSMRATAVVASAVVKAVRQLFADLERGRRIDAAVLSNAMEAAFSASDATDAWNWKTGYDACGAATVLFLRRYGGAMRARTASPAVMLSMLTRIAGLLPSQTRRSEESQSLQQFSTPMGLAFVASVAEGILFATYATLRTDERGEKLSRVQQIVEWLGSDFDGVIVFDESHAMQNAVGGKGERGDQAASQQGRAGPRLQHGLPNAPAMNAQAKSATQSAFESAKQRFFEHLLTSMKMPSLTMRDRLCAYALFGDIISWKLRVFVPAHVHGAEVLAKVLERYPIERITKRQAA